MSTVLLDLFRSTRDSILRWLWLICLVFAEAETESTLARVAIAFVALVSILEAAQINRTARVLRAMALGDRYVAFPSNFVHSPACDYIGSAGERMRKNLIEADAAIAEQRGFLAETRIRRDGAAFYTARFHATVADEFNNFSDRGEQICTTVGDLSKSNAKLLLDAQSVNAAVRETATDVGGMSQAARDIAALVDTTSTRIRVAAEVTQETIADLGRASATVGRLRRAAEEIAGILDVIGAVANQTSLLALNATIEAARAGEAGRGFAVVASEVKMLATRSAEATSTICRQIEDMQGAVEDTSSSIDGILARINRLATTHDDFTTSLRESTLAIEQVGSNAGAVASRISDTMPDLATGASDIEAAGRTVLDNAQQLLARSEVLVDRFRTYFEDLASGSIKVGILFSLSGATGSSEPALNAMTLGLIEDANRDGGVLGRPLEALIANPRDDATGYGEAAARLRDAGASVIFGGWTSQSRLDIAGVLARKGGLLFYPSNYEGGEVSPNVICTGATPRQQAWPAVDFFRGRGCQRIVLIGTLSLFSREMHKAIRAYAAFIGVTVVADVTVDDHETRWDRTLALLDKATRDTVGIITTLPSKSSGQYFCELARRGLTARKAPTVCLSIGEGELTGMSACQPQGHFVAANYLSALEDTTNHSLIAAWRRYSGDATARPDSALEANDRAFNAWRRAVTQAGDIDPDRVRAVLNGLSVPSATGFPSTFTPDRHTTLPCYIGQIQPDMSLKAVWRSAGVIEPVAPPIRLTTSA